MVSIGTDSHSPIMVLYLETGDQLYGGQRCLLELVEFMEDSGRVECWLACPPNSAPAKNAPLPGERILPFPLNTNQFAEADPFKKLILLARAVAWLYRALPIIKPHLIHANTFLAWQAAALTRIFRKFPLIAHKRDLTKRRVITHIALILTNAVISISPAITKLFLKSLHHKKIFTIHDGLPLTTDRLPEAKPRSVVFAGDHPSLSDPQSKLIGVVGNLHHLKGQDLVLQSAPEFLSQVRDSHILFIGDYYGSPRERTRFRRRLEELASQPQLAKKIHFLGFREAFPDYIANLDLLLIPSREEGLGRVIFEGLACGRSVLASRSGGPEYLASKGCPITLFNFDDRERMVKAIVEILQTKPTKAERKRYLRFLEEYGLISYSGGRTLELYRQVLSKYHPESPSVV